MKHFASPRFWQTYRQLPTAIRVLADRSFALLKSNPDHPSLHFKRIKDVWSVRVGLHHRALGAEEGDDVVWCWIGSHAEYDRLIGRTKRKGARQPAGRSKAPRGK